MIKNSANSVCYIGRKSLLNIVLHLNISGGRKKRHTLPLGTGKSYIYILPIILLNYLLQLYIFIYIPT